MWCWRKLLRVPWTARRSNQSILKEISPEYSLEGLMLKLKLQYFGHLTQRTDSFEKILMLEKIEGGRRRQRMRYLDGITDSWTWVCVNSRSWWWTGRPGVLQSMGSQRVGHDWATELNLTEGYRKSSRSYQHMMFKKKQNLKKWCLYGIICVQISFMSKICFFASLENLAGQHTGEGGFFFSESSLVCSLWTLYNKNLFFKY